LKNSTQTLALEKSKKLLQIAKETATDSLTFATEALFSVRLSNKLHAPENATSITPRQPITPRASIPENYIRKKGKFPITVRSANLSSSSKVEKHSKSQVRKMENSRSPMRTASIDLSLPIGDVVQL